MRARKSEGAARSGMPFSGLVSDHSGKRDFQSEGYLSRLAPGRGKRTIFCLPW